MKPIVEQKVEQKPMEQPVKKVEQKPVEVPRQQVIVKEQPVVEEKIKEEVKSTITKE